jgi:hypothetical protein
MIFNTILGADDEGREVGEKPEITASGTPGILGVNYLPPLADGEPYQVMKVPMLIVKVFIILYWVAY